MGDGVQQHALRPDRGAWLPVIAGACAATVLIVAALVSTMGVRLTAREAIDQEVHENLIRLAAMAASSIDGELHAKLQDPSQEETTLYSMLNQPLTNAIRRTEGVRFVYTLRRVGTDLVFVLDGTPLGDSDNDGVEDHSFLMDVYDDPDPAAWEAIRTNRITASDEPYTDQWGTFLSSYAPIRRESGAVEGIVGVDVSVGHYQARLQRVDKAATWALVPGLVLSLLTGVGVWWFTRRFVGYANQIEEHRAVAVRANKAKSALLASISHELRTPLNAIIGFSAIANDARSTSDERSEALGTVRSNADHLLTLIGDLLDISKAEAGAIRIECSEVDLPELIDRAVVPMRLRAMEKHIGFEVVGLESLPDRVVLDRTRVRQVLLNLLSNAVKFTDAGFVRLTLSVCENNLTMRVEDTGPGISDEERSVLFTPFTQLGPHEKRVQGTGLGLTITRHLLELMGGSIGFESYPGKGSAFTAVVPYELVHCEPSDGDSERRNRLAHEPLAGVRIVLADDGEDNLRLLSLILRRAGAQCKAFEDGEQALDSIMLEPDQCDLLITDWDMPVLCGEGLVRQLRESSWTRPIISLTAHAMPEQEQLCLSVGCDAHLTKPINAQRLITTCIDLLKQTGRTQRAA